MRVASGSVPIHRAKAVEVVELLGLVACAAALAALALRAAASLDGAYAPAAAGVLCGYLAADVATGFVHWFGDRFFEEDTPGIGPRLIQPFREHHRDPAGMTRHGWLELCGNSALALSPVLAAALVRPLGPLLDGALITFGLAVLGTNLFHCWAHAERVPRLVARLQSAGLILSPQAHARHHAAPHDAAYCVTSGWANRALDRLALFAGLERVFVRLGLPATRQP
jgi:plasmanylethanolamine desaturase